MAEAEDVLVDAARHATIYARRLWARHRPGVERERITLAAVAERLTTLVQAAFGIVAPLRVAQEPAIPTLLTRVFRRQSLPRHVSSIPATDGNAIWLPRQLPDDAGDALGQYRCMTLLQAMRIRRGSVNALAAAEAGGVRDLYLLAEAAAAERDLAAVLPGLKSGLAAFRAAQLARRPSLDHFADVRRPLEMLARRVMRGESRVARSGDPAWTPAHSLELAGEWAGELRQQARGGHVSAELFRDSWTGDLRPPGAQAGRTTSPGGDDEAPTPPKSARLARRPDVRAAKEGEDDDARQGAWMIQTSQPAETAEDPFGLQRPVDLDQDASADEYADSVSELGEARLVSSPERAREVLVSDDPPDAVTRRELARGESVAELDYPEWDYRQQAYRHPGARVRRSSAPLGPDAWVRRMAREHGAMCEDIRRRFEMLRAVRERARKQIDGDDLDIDACVESRADVVAGLPMSHALYQHMRLTRRDLAITLLVDVSGSTDSWISEHRRIIDVEREALLLVCHALEGLREPYNILAFSGEGPRNVTVRDVKTFDDRFGEDVARRIAALEPERYTRAGAALRHATSGLLRRAARHRLLLLLSDGKPNDNDEYDGRYGAEDMRQAVTEARLQGIFAFCLTVDRQAASYLPRVFGPHNYALLHKPALLPTVLLEWMRRLIAA